MCNHSGALCVYSTAVGSHVVACTSRWPGSFQLHPQRFRRYAYVSQPLIVFQIYTIWTQLNWEGMNYPSGNRDFDRFEENNHDNISVHVYNMFQFEGK